MKNLILISVIFCVTNTANLTNFVHEMTITNGAPTKLSIDNTPNEKIEIRGVKMSEILKLLKEIEPYLQDGSGVSVEQPVHRDMASHLRYQADKLEREAELKARIKEIIKKLEEKK